MRPLHWLLALLGACSIHLAMAYGFVSHASSPVDSTIGAHDAGVRIQLGMQGASLAPEVTATPEVDNVAEPVPEPPPVKPSEKVVAPPEIKSVVVSVEKVEPPDNAVLIQLEEQPQDEQEEMTTAPFSPPTQTDSPESRTVANASRQLDNNVESGTSGSQSVQHTAAYASAKNDYFARLMGTLQRNKRYPSDAKKKKEQGTVLLQFSINKRGEVLTAIVVESSGHPLLDDAALQMLRKASPLPSIPDSLAQQSLEVTIPVEYSLITK